jgi:LPXTG-site transpeptidase (sortase) family protein
MISNASRWIANLFIWTGLALIILGCALAYPFMRDAILAQSDPSVSQSFVVTPPLAPTEVASVAPTGTSTPWPASEALVSVTPSLVPSATAVPAPVVLPDNNTAITRAQTLPSVVLPAPVAAGDPPDWLVISSIQLDAPVEVVGWHLEQGLSVWDVPARRAAGWLKTSAPAGQKGNTVLDGHHNIQGEVFRRLVDLKPGAVVELSARGKVYRYSVTERHILPDRDEPMEVRIANAKWIQPTNDERLTLVTCWPYTNNTHRLIIVARPLAPNRMEKRIE